MAAVASDVGRETDVAVVVGAALALVATVGATTATVVGLSVARGVAKAVEGSMPIIASAVAVWLATAVDSSPAGATSFDAGAAKAAGCDAGCIT